MNKNNDNADLNAYIEKKYNLGWNAIAIVDTYNTRRGYTATSIEYVNGVLHEIRKKHALRYQSQDMTRAPRGGGK